MKLEDTVLIKALKELDYRLNKLGTKPFDLKTVGGFALLVENIRPINVETQYTDIDYVGEEFDQEVKEIINEIGARYRLGKDWVNRDVVLDGLNESEFELSTGELHYDKAFELSVITVYTARPQDLLKMKVIAVSTSYLGWHNKGGDFTRFKDLKDIKLLMERLGWDFNKLLNETKYYIEDLESYRIIKAFLKDDSLDSFEAIVAELKIQRIGIDLDPDSLLDNDDYDLFNDYNAYGVDFY